MPRLNYTPREHDDAGEGRRHGRGPTPRPASPHRPPARGATPGRRRRGGGAGGAHDAGFGEFPAAPHGATPHGARRRRGDGPPPQSRIRFAEETRHPVLVLDGNEQQPRRAAAASETAPAAASLDFSMIATPGGKLARMVDHHGFYTPSEATTTTHETGETASGRSLWTAGTPFRSILRGVVSSTPSLHPRQLLTSTGKTPYTAAREQLRPTPGDTAAAAQAHGDEDDAHARTALEFARAAPLSGYLRKMGKNIPTFKRRFFVLKPSTHLYYFLSPDDVEPRGCIDLDMTRNGEAGGGGSCEVREIGAAPDGTFRFELRFDAERDPRDAASPRAESRAQRQFHRQSIVLEARTADIGREWMAKLRSERLSSARDAAEGLRASLAEMTAVRGRWETSACEEAMRADAAARQRDAAISEAKGWEGRFTDLNEALRLLGKSDTDQALAEGGANNSASGADFLTEALQGPNVEGTYFNQVSQRFQTVHTNYQHTAKREELAKERIARLEQRAQEAESRAANAETELARVWEDNLTLRKDLNKARREKQILVKEVRSWHAATAEEDASKRSEQKQPHDSRSTNSLSGRSRGGASSSNGCGASSVASQPKRKLNAVEQRLVIELEEHVMSGLRLSERFLTLNGVDPSEAGCDDSVQTSKASVHKSPERQSTRRPPPQALLHLSPPRPLLNLSPPPTARITNVTHETRQQQRAGTPLGSLLDETDDVSQVALVGAGVEAATVPGGAMPETDRYSEGDGSNLSYTADSIPGSDLLIDMHQYEEGSSGENPINQNLNERFREQVQIDPREATKNQRTMPLRLPTDESSACRAPPSLEVASSVSESSRSRVTDNGNATTKLECPLRDVEVSPSHCRNGKLYHITCYGKKIGLQFQKVPNDTASPGLLTAAMTADHGPNVEANQTAAELRRIAALSQRAPTRHDRTGGTSTECHPVTPSDAVLVCGFVGFDDSTGNVRPRVGARLVAFDGIPVEVGHWTFESIRKSIQARGRPLTLSFRNDFLTLKQREILTKAIEDVTPPPPSAAHAHHIPKGTSSTRERYHNHLHGKGDNTISTSASSLSSQRSQPKSKYYSTFSEAGSSISAVAPLISNLLSNGRLRSGQPRTDFAPDYLQRTSDSLEKMQHHHDFQSGLL